MKYVSIIISFVLLFLACCSKVQEDSTTEQLIAQAEQIQNNPSEVVTLLKNISPDNVNDSLLLRWCISFGKAANKLNQNELISIADFTKALDYCNTIQEKALINYLLGAAYYEHKYQQKHSLYNYCNLSIEYYKKALSLTKECNEYNLAGDIYFSLAHTYQYQQIFSDSKECYKRAAEMYTKGENLQDEVRAKSNAVYDLIYLDSVQAAFKYAIETEKDAEKGNNITKSHIANALAFTHKVLGDYVTAEKYALKAISLDSINTASHYLLLASIYTKQERYTEAHKILDIAETANSRNKQVPMTSALFRSQIYKAEGNMEAYKIHYQKYKQYLNHFDISASIDRMAKMEKELNVSEAEVLLLTKIQKFIFSNFGLILLAFFIGMLAVIRYQKRKIKKTYKQISLTLDDELSSIKEINSKLSELDKQINNLKG